MEMLVGAIPHSLFATHYSPLDFLPKLRERQETLARELL
jgi:hypothetical protein